MKESIILGLIYAKPMSGYAIYALMEKCHSYYKKISLSSLYSSLYEMEKNGLLTKKQIKEGKRPEKQIFAITEKGKKEFIATLHTQLEEIIPMADEFNWVIPFLGYLPKTQVAGSLERRLQFFRGVEKELGALQTAKQMAFHKILIQRATAHVGAEIKWISETLKKL